MCGSPVSFLSAIPFIMDGAGAVLTTGTKGSFPNIPFAFQLLTWTAESPLAGDFTLDVLCAPYAANAFPSTSIVAAAAPTMTAVKSASGSCATWTNGGTIVGGNVPAGYSLAIALSAVATLQLISLSFKIRRVIM